ncbi:PE-PPE domain-containing protein, partial [Mycobacterium sp.]|uniref:PE-PPE domain-containing protein n=1 Tax=Mycobacterium sp. TaxID=1785 RepID=UPI0031D2E5DD
MSARTLRLMGLGMVATAGAGVVSLAALLNPTPAHADGQDVGLVIGGSGTPIPGPEYVASAAEHYLFPTYGENIDFYQGTTPTTTDPLAGFGNGLFTPEGLYPLTGVKTLPLNYPAGTDGFPSGTTSVGQGDTILYNTIGSDIANGDTSTVFGYSQSSTISSYVMQQLENAGVPKADVNFLLVGDPSAPNGGLLSRFDGFETTSGQTVSDPLNLPSLGVSFDSSTPASDYATSIYSIEYDGFADFPRYPLNFLADVNAFLGIETLHGTYLNGGNGTDGLGTGPSAADIAHATLLPVSSADTETSYHMITTLGGTDTTPGADITAPLVAVLPKPLQELLGPDLTYLINLGYGDGSVGYSTADANVNTPFGLAPDVSASTMLSTLETDTAQGFHDLMSGTDPYAAATGTSTAATQSMAEVMSALSTDLTNPATTLTDFA